MDERRLAEFGEAWNRHDPDLLMGWMSAQPVYRASFGPELHGVEYRGRAAVREGFRRFFERYPDGRFEDARCFVAGERGGAEWTFVATEPDGSRLEVRGADLFEFDGDAIRVKDAFRKVRG